MKSLARYADSGGSLRALSCSPGGAYFRLFSDAPAQCYYADGQRHRGETEGAGLWNLPDAQVKA
jgi:hypothetical protein